MCTLYVAFLFYYLFYLIHRRLQFNDSKCHRKLSYCENIQVYNAINYHSIALEFHLTSFSIHLLNGFKCIPYYRLCMDIV